MAVARIPATRGIRDGRCRASSATHGLRWRGYFQGLPHPGYVGGDVGAYVQHHNPFVFFKTITKHRNIQPFSRFRASLGRPPAFSLIVPDNNHNMHTGTINTADRFLHAWIPKIIDSRGFHRGGVVFITWDEGHGDSSGCCLPGIHGGRTALIAITPHHHKTRLTHPRTAYSLLRTIEDGFHFGHLANASRVPPLNRLWH